MVRALKESLRPRVRERTAGTGAAWVSPGPLKSGPTSQGLQLPAAARSPFLGRKALAVLGRTGRGTCRPLRSSRQSAQDSDPDLLVPTPTLISLKVRPRWNCRPSLHGFKPGSLHSDLGQWPHRGPGVHGRQTDETAGTDPVVTWHSRAVGEGDRKPGQRPRRSAGTCTIPTLPIRCASLASCYQELPSAREQKSARSILGQANEGPNVRHLLELTA